MVQACAHGQLRAQAHVARCAAHRRQTAPASPSSSHPRCFGPGSARGRAPFRPVAALPFFSNPFSKKEDKGSDAGAGGEGAGSELVQPAHFDLPLAVVLAGAAFESYLQPQAAEGGAAFLQRSVGGPTVTYTDKWVGLRAAGGGLRVAGCGRRAAGCGLRAGGGGLRAVGCGRAFLTEVYTGVLVVELAAAANLRPADPNGASDPYAVLSLGGATHRSPTQPATLNPTWQGDVACFYVKDPAADVLRVRLYDEDLGKSDEDLGTAMLGLAALAGSKGRRQSFTLPLRGAGSGNGASVTLRARFLAFADADPDDVAALTSTSTTAPSAPAVAGLQAAAAAVQGVVEAVTAATGDAAAGEKAKDDAAAAAGGGGTVSLPDGDQVPNPWRLLAAMVGRAAGASALQPVAFVESEETDTQAWLYRNVEAREAVIAFRGTEQVKWKDIATDLNLTPCSLNPERLDDNAGLPFSARIIKAVSGANQNQLMVHKGFLDAYDSVRRTCFRLLDDITGSGEKAGGRPWRVLVTGHSLGGALATLAAYELAERRTPARSVQRISLYSYGAPRVGNKAFAEAFDRLVPDTWRITNTNDIVPSVPRLMGYCHVGHAVRLGADGRLVAAGRSTAEGVSTDVFGEGKAGVEVIQDIVSQVQEQSRPWDEVYEEIKEREMQLLNALVGGQGLEEHMETFYLASLQQAVQAAAQAQQGQGQAQQGQGQAQQGQGQGQRK
ncbi:hypothetical protein HYH02_014261 [Chlamydomonas schloesseri]|uniref:C2 domain-containing protein n=1 Tax=Chlamydomonas schloesseri TaxID=2026947 RepID=A0A835VX65_9CHLO|nr:hypothetical protein HYH02_014261 [Chlamydomonas schloesseri]|eukprot:KAG2428849.1 hypothetical protein HYH02_014261 [Chlamydomonas schloesseri]